MLVCQHNYFPSHLCLIWDSLQVTYAQGRVRKYFRNVILTLPTEQLITCLNLLFLSRLLLIQIMTWADTGTIAYTFGGQFVGGDPYDINNWRNDPGLIGSYNKEPRRVPKVRGRGIQSSFAMLFSLGVQL